MRIARLAAACSLLVRALALRSGDDMYSDIADHVSVPVNSRSHRRFSADESSRVVARCHNVASGTANVRTPDIAKSTVFGVSKPRAQVNAKLVRPHRLSATEIAATQRGTVGRGDVEFIGSPASQSTPFRYRFTASPPHRNESSTRFKPVCRLSAVFARSAVSSYPSNRRSVWIRRVGQA